MELKAEEIKNNWDMFMKYINNYISSPRKEKLIEFYERHEERIMLMPASSKVHHHSCFPGGHIFHTLKVCEFALKIHEMWEMSGVDETYTLEELMFSALNHDLGKIGTETEPNYIPNTDKWRKEKLGEIYKHNDQFTFMTVPDRGIFLLQENNIPITMNEYIAIRAHDGLYDEANKYYFIGYMPETRPRSSILHILHTADMLAARWEFEQTWLKDFNKKSNLVSEKGGPILTNTTNGSSKPSLGNKKSQGLKNLLDTI